MKLCGTSNVYDINKHIEEVSVSGIKNRRIFAHFTQYLLIRKEPKGINQSQFKVDMSLNCGYTARAKILHNTEIVQWEIGEG